MRRIRGVALLFLATSLVAQGSSAQTPAMDPSARLRAVLPADVAQRVLSRIADARARQLPAEALENRALKFAAKGVAPGDIERSVNEQADRMGVARNAIVRGRGAQARGDEIEAGAEALRKGVDGAAVSMLAKSAPPKRSLAVALFVIGSLADRGLPSDEAVKRVLDKLDARASDADLERMPGQLPAQAARGQANRPDPAGSGVSAAKRPATIPRPASAGPPAGVPANAGIPANPGRGTKPPPGI